MTVPEHYNQLLVTVLPRERRARHPYQLCVMLALITFAAAQLILGAPERAAINELPLGQQNALNWFCLIAGILGLWVAVIPERVVTLLRLDFDATWVRLITEGADQALLAFVWGAYLATVQQRIPVTEGISLSTGLAFWLMIAAGWRAAQIGWTIKGAVVDPSEDSVIVGAETLGQGKGG